jgi:undecaprenyl-diphosphatase
MTNSIIIFLANYLYIIIILIAIIAIVLANQTARKNILTLAFLTFPLAFIIANILGRLFYNPRPFVVEHIKPLIPHAANNGFPSDHTLLVISIASIVFVFNKRLGSVLFLLGLLVGFARILAEVHHPIDIFTSITVAIFSTYISWRILKNYNKNKIKKGGV